MSEPIEFYFDFYSPYSYFASFRINEIAARHGRTVNWHPILLGAVFKITGATPLTNIPMMGEYALTDMQRSSRRYQVPFQLPARFPHAALAASRAFYWIDDQDSQQSQQFAQAFFRQGFGEGKDLTDLDLTLDIAAEVGVDRAQLATALGTDPVKNRLKEEVSQAIALKIFGAPFFLVDKEPFWGNDRLDELDLWLQRGGW